MRRKETTLSNAIAMRLLALAACAACAFVTAMARADAAPGSAVRPDAGYGYTMALGALTGPRGADLTIVVTPLPGYPVPESIKKLQIKIFDAGGKLDDVRNLNDVPAPGAGDDPARHARPWAADRCHALVQTGRPSRTHVLQGETLTKLRPDLVVAAVDAPPQTLTTRPIDVGRGDRRAERRHRGDRARDADVGPTPLAGPTDGDGAEGRQSLGHVPGGRADNRHVR